MDNKKPIKQNRHFRNSHSKMPRHMNPGHNSTMLSEITSNSSSSDSMISSVAATITKDKHVPATQLLQEKMDIQYNKYLRIKLKERLIKKNHTIQKCNVFNQAYQLCEIKQKLLHLKLSAESQNEQTRISEQLQLLIDENCKYLDETMSLFENKIDNYNELLQNLQINASKVSMENIDLTNYDNESFINLLQSIYNSLQLLVSSQNANKMIDLKEIFEQLETYNNDLHINVNEVLDICKNTAKNSIIATANELIMKQNIENSQTEQ